MQGIHKLRNKLAKSKQSKQKAIILTPNEATILNKDIELLEHTINKLSLQLESFSTTTSNNKTYPSSINGGGF